MSPFGVYVHVPFCAVRCDYCAFATWADREELIPRYLAACRTQVEREVAAGLPPVTSVFVGGGTPSLVPAASLLAVLEPLPLAPGAEVTIECNPDTVTPSLVEAYVAGGVNRISLGVQSMVPSVLAALGRTHDPANVTRAVAAVTGAGIENWNADVIYGAACETVEQWAATLDGVLALDPPHVSAYGLTVEPGTALADDPVRHPDDDDQADKYLLATERLGDAGLAWYEISNWARPGHECRHNLGYWSLDGQWWGFGPGAHSLIDGARFHNVKHPRGYAQLLRRGELPRAAVEQLSAEDRRLEAVMLGLRLRAGLPAEGLPESEVAALVADGLLQRRDERIVLTRTGRLLADRVTLSLLG